MVRSQPGAPDASSGLSQGFAGQLSGDQGCDSPFLLSVRVLISPASGKAYEITYVRLKFHTSRPESFAIYKRSRAGGPWEPYQYYSASCLRTYGRPEGHHLRPGEDERLAFCTSEFSDISPLSGGNVAFSTLEGRPSAYNFEESPGLQVREQRGSGGGGQQAGCPSKGTAEPCFHTGHLEALGL